MGRKFHQHHPKRLKFSQKTTPDIKNNVTTKSRCCYCGRILYPDTWHYMWDEYGQRVKKCNNELECYRHRKDRAEEAYRNAIREKQFNKQHGK